MCERIHIHPHFHQDTSHPVLDHVLVPESTLELVGDVITATDLPPRCFVSTFQDGVRDPVDYYTCRTCVRNWLCHACAGTCHREHDVIVFAKDHVPTWACCYCMRTKCCVLSAPS